MLTTPRAIVAGVTLGILLSLMVVPRLISNLITANASSTPLSNAIVAAIEKHPGGLSDVSGELCKLATPAELAISVGELWPLGASIIGDVGGLDVPEGTVAAWFSQFSPSAEGLMTLRIYVNDDQKFCRATIQLAQGVIAPVQAGYRTERQPPRL